MQDGIINGTGNSRYLKTISGFLSLYPTYEAFAQAVIAGTLPVDLNGKNPDGWAQQGTPLNKANLLTDATAALVGLGAEANPDEMFATLANRITYGTEELTPGVRAVARKNVTVNEPFFAGHFPGNPVMPGVLIIEALAQTGAVAMLSVPEFKGKTAYFAGIDRAKFRQKVLPGDTLMLETEIVKCKGPIGIGRATARVDGKTVCQAELTFAIS